MTGRFPSEFLAEVGLLLSMSENIEELNKHLKDKTGIICFFKSYHELKEFKQFLDDYHVTSKKNRDLGDFQTSIHLTDKICRYVADIGFAPDAIVEPTCGEGNFVVSAVRLFPSLKYAYCVDVQSKYEWLFKLNMLRLSFEQNIHVTTEFHHDNIFTHRISDRFESCLDSHIQNLLILGNPPWVTNSELSTLDSGNLPSKANIKGYRGIEAITGKGNFDIAEYIILQIIHRFSGRKGKLAMLCKTSVIKNIVRDMQQLHLKISNIQALLIDAKKEFGINADAALLVADLNSGEGSLCTVSFLYQPNCESRKYGWIGSNFVSNIELYDKYKYIDGQSPFAWRQGVKHDASKVMVLRTNADGTLLNGLQEYADVEEDLLYPFVKGSELKKLLVREAANKVIITQTSPNEDTGYIALRYPELWAYLISHSKYLDKRKSSIYKRKPRFSIFGIGDYSFKPYKVAVSGFYKKCNFSLIPPIDGRPAMLDDTCYYLSFDNFSDAFFTWALLNTDDVRRFLSSIVFLDSKRPYTKAALMRIDILRLAERIPLDTLSNICRENLKGYIEYEFNEEDFSSFKDSLKIGTINLFQLR
jgi:hypothetical protein